MSKILITGGQERENGFELGEGKYYKAAKLLRLDTQTGIFEELITLDTGSVNYPDEYPNLEFTAGAVEGERLWLATDTEIHEYSYPELERLRTASFPFFHNIHHVQPFEKYIAVVSTGLDLIVLLDRENLEPLEFLNAEGKNPWFRFSPEQDYRKIHSTRPHDSHPNYIFKLAEELWVTRCTQEDAVCLRDTSKRIDISGKKTISVHDGHVLDDKVYFSSVDGYIVIADANTYQVVADIDLAALDKSKHAKGWCRGILFEGNIIFVAFSRLWKTKNRGKIDWLYKLSGNTPPPMSASIAAYDLKKMEKIGEWTLPALTLDAIYSLFPEPR